MTSEDDKTPNQQAPIVLAQAGQPMNLGFHISVQELEDRLDTHLEGIPTSVYRYVVPLRQIVSFDLVTLMRTTTLERLIRKIRLRSQDSTEVCPYAQSQIKLYRTEPKGLYIGQTFMLRSKILSIMENLQRGGFEMFCMPGISKMPPAQIYGRTAQGELAIGFYIPPIVEKHNGKDILIDGIHRSYICSSGGTTVNAVHISNVQVPPPFTPIDWNKLKTMDSKPPIEKRYIDLNKELFRDLGVVGIDG